MFPIIRWRKSDIESLIFGGFTLIELLIVFSIICVFLAVAIPVYSNFSARNNISEALSVSESIKAQVGKVCIGNPTIPLSNNIVIGDGSFPLEENPYVGAIQIRGSCRIPQIIIVTKSIGRVPSPILLLTGDPLKSDNQIFWLCSSSNTPSELLPSGCRS